MMVMVVGGRRDPVPTAGPGMMVHDAACARQHQRRDRRDQDLPPWGPNQPDFHAPDMIPAAADHREYGRARTIASTGGNDEPGRCARLAGGDSVRRGEENKTLSDDVVPLSRSRGMDVRADPG